MSDYGGDIGAGGYLGFFGAPQTTRPASANQAAVTATVTTTQTTTTLKADLASAITLINQMRSDLVTLGLIKGSA